MAVPRRLYKSMVLRAVHRTVYQYPTSVGESHNEVRLQPLTDDTQKLLDFRITTTPATRVYHYREVGGTAHHFTVRLPHTSLEILAEAIVETHLQNPFEDLNLLDPDDAFYRSEAIRQATIEFLTPSRYVPLIPKVFEIAQLVSEPGQSTASFLLALNHYLHELLDYDTDATHVHSTVSEVLHVRAGVCQDFAHVMIACCRVRGIPARYVSGYLFVDAGSGMRGEQATHAWVECLLPSGRWLGLDPTNDLLTNDRYIRVHTGRDYSEVSPTRGIYVGPQTEKLHVSVSVQSWDSAPVAS